MTRSTRHCRGVAGLLIPLALVLACFALSPQARAVCQDGCDLINGNTFLGDDALLNNTDGVQNTAIGAFALLDNTTGSSNTANGVGALELNTTGSANTAIGHGALFSNITGIENTAIGAFALRFNTTGRNNTANGSLALWRNATGNSNTATGQEALRENRQGSRNTADGESALSRNRGSDNTAVGQRSLLGNKTGSHNIAVGSGAGSELTSGDSNIDIGNTGVAGEAATIRIGTTGTQSATYIAGISGATVPTGVAVIVDANGHLGTTTSSARYKERIKPMDQASEAILALRPVTFRYKHELDPDGIPQFGLVAEDVEKVNPDLVARDEQGKPYTVRYDVVNAMLLNEFLKGHRKGEQQDRKIEELAATVAKLESVLKEQASQIQKVSAQVELSKPGARTVGNNQ